MPNTKRDYKKLLESGNKAQLEKLKNNEHKSGFENLDIDYAFERLKEEVHELLVELQGVKERNPSDIRSEAADVANFAYMIILKCDQEINK